MIRCSEGFCGDCVVGVDDGFFKRGWRYTVLCGAVHCRCEGWGWVPVRLGFSLVEVDGVDATDSLVSLVEGLGVEPALVVVDTPIFAGFNVADLVEAWRRLRVPIASVHMYWPDIDAIGWALRRHFVDWRERFVRVEVVYSLLRRLVCSRGRELYVAVVGGSYGEAARLLCSLQLYSRVPEPLYTAGRVASRLSRRLAGLLAG